MKDQEFTRNLVYFFPISPIYKQSSTYDHHVAKRDSGKSLIFMTVAVSLGHEISPFCDLLTRKISEGRGGAGFTERPSSHCNDSLTNGGKKRSTYQVSHSATEIWGSITVISRGSAAEREDLFVLWEGKRLNSVGPGEKFWKIKTESKQKEVI